jgi:glycosyltransferase involved in cell wall biosynthesis
MNVSVVITTYNRSALLRRALDSVLAQSFPAQEVVVVDDGGRDDSLAVVQSYTSALNIKYVWKPIQDVACPGTSA